MKTTRQARIPLVSVIIPTYNRARYLTEAVESCLHNDATTLPVEIVVVDDGSDDNTRSALEKFTERITYISLETNQGRNRARNVGLQRARGEFVKFLDSDDVLEPGSLATEYALARDSVADIVVSGWRCVELVPDGPDRPLARYDAPVMYPVVDCILAGRAVPTSAALYLRTLVCEMRWDERLRKLDDWDWFIRAALCARKIVRAENVAYSWRQHPTQGIHAESMFRNALEHHAILEKLESALEKNGLLTPARRRRLAQYFYKEMRVLCLHDKTHFDQAVRHIYELDPRFVPRDEERQWWMRVLCRVVGVRYALSAHSAIKQLVKRGDRR